MLPKKTNQGCRELLRIDRLVFAWSGSLGPVAAPSLAAWLFASRKRRADNRTKAIPSQKGRKPAPGPYSAEYGNWRDK